MRAATAPAWLPMVARPEERRHGEADEHHEDHGDAGLDPLLDRLGCLGSLGVLRNLCHRGLGVALQVLLATLMRFLAVRYADDAPQREGRQQDFHLDGLHRKGLVGDVAHELASCRDQHRVDGRPAPRAAEGQGVELPVCEAQHQEDQSNLDGELPLEPGHADLEWHQQEQGAQVVKDSQDPGLPEEPCLLQAGRLQHTEEDAGAGGSRKEA
mmetsp:Transcript_142387/g.442753  ORF Transcript_142387/g.442753 Transcript_142387/m.442753 type:complete len:212 (+) Transcript_142387:1180-1815(+)